MTKKDRILKLNDGARTMEEIAALVGCLPAYCRVVIRQRKGGGTSDIDRKYLASDKGRKTKNASNAQSRIYMRVLAKTGNLDKANGSARKAYREARDLGADVKTACKVFNRTRMKHLYNTGDKTFARAAAKLARHDAHKGTKSELSAKT